MGVGQKPFSEDPKILRLIWRIVMIGVLVIVFHLLLDWTIGKIDQEANMPLMIGLLSAVLLAYAVLLAIPFMPGIEIGIGLLLLRGAEVAPFVYIATLMGLIIAFTGGRSISYNWLHGFFADLRLKRACKLLERLHPLGGHERLELLSSRLPRWLRPLVGRTRYLLLAVLLNVPGNVVLGGGGGLAFAAGFSKLFHPLPAFVAIAIAVLPVPLGVWIYGSGFIGSE